MIVQSRILKTSCGCWLYLDKSTRDGSRFVGGAPSPITGEWIAAPRAQWEERRGPIPEGLCVLHRCDIPACIRLGHLWLGTRDDNNKDRARKGRTVIPDHTGMKRSAETRRRQSESRKAYFAANPGKHPLLGRVMPMAQRLAHSLKMTGRKQPAETIAKRAISLRAAWARRKERIK